MADSGMLLNFDLGDAPLKKQVKFTGGRWRDRVRAQRSAKKVGGGGRVSRGPSSGGNKIPLTNDRRDRNRDRETGDGDGNGDEAFGDGDRPTKRQRTEMNGPGGPRGERGSGRPGASEKSLSYMTGKLPPGNISTGQRHGHGHQEAGGMVTSRLFTSNPTPRTVFEDHHATVEESEPAKPSNAPLSEEAANFLALGLSRRLAQHLSTKLGMKAPTSIQKNAIPPLVRDDSDAFLQAETGSGKTLAYLLPIVQRIVSLSQHEDGSTTGTQIHRNSGLLAVVLAPTRELCKQIAAVLERVLRCAPWIVSTTVIGGESKKSEKARLRKGVNILIATPGRLADHLDNTRVLDVGTARWLILDEGDRLMEMGFEDELRSIVAKIRREPLRAENEDGVRFDSPGTLPQRRVTVLCSATMKMNVQKLGEISLEDAVHITASKADAGGDADAAGETGGADGTDGAVSFSAPSQLKQSFLIVPAKLRLVTLIALLKSSFARKGSVMKAIIFISCADSVDFHFDLLRDAVAPASTTKAVASDDQDDSDSDNDNDNRNGKSKAVESLTTSTVADAAYITSPANPTVRLLRLHGSLQQPVRTATLAAFRNSREPSVLVTTDIASRGLDVPAVDLVIEYDPAFSADDHVHRVGRTARAGRAGKASLFLQPGCEEGYIGFLNPGPAASTQPYEPIIQKGFVTPIVVPRSPSSSLAAETEPPPDDGKPSPLPTLVTEKQSPNARAEALQLHLEQRLLASGGKEGKEKEKEKDSAGAGKLLDSARRAFRSHVRAYATHVREERGFFDITQLHLGHAAKSFGLREAPGGIGGGPTSGGRRRAAAAAAARGKSGEKGGVEKGVNQTRGAADSDDEVGGRGGGGGGVDEDAARRMRMKMKAVMNASGEFNIG